MPWFCEILKFFTEQDLMYKATAKTKDVVLLKGYHWFHFSCLQKAIINLDGSSFLN